MAEQDLAMPEVDEALMDRAALCRQVYGWDDDEVMLEIRRGSQVVAGPLPTGALVSVRGWAVAVLPAKDGPPRGTWGIRRWVGGRSHPLPTAILEWTT
jgi:hypothetical protein